MRYNLNEEKGDIRYEVENDTLILKVKPGVVGTGGDNTYHIKTDDVTTPTDVNAFTALRVLREIANTAESITADSDGRYLRKDVDDTAEGNITFLKTIAVIAAALLKSGAEFGEYEEGIDGAKIDAEGNTELGSALVRLLALLKGGAEFGGYKEGVTGAKIDSLGNAELGKAFVRLLALLKGGAEFGDYAEGAKGAKVDAEGDAELKNLIVRLKAIIGELQVNGNAEFRGNLSNEEFTSGFIGGTGWSIFKQEVLNAVGQTEKKYTAEFDNVVVRGALRVFTMVISQLLGENDNRIFTAMMEVDHYDAKEHKVYLKTENGKYYNPFRVGDYIMVQQYNGMPSKENDYYITKHYECIVTDAGLGSDGENRLDWVTISNFVSADGKEAEDLITENDTFVRVDNATDADRKGIIQIITVGTATPYMDIIYGLKTDPNNYLKGRLGNLKGIKHHLFGWLDGFGEYLTNLYAVGDFRLRQTGESVNAAVQMTRDQFATNYSKVTYDITEDNNLLTNATFTESMDGWTTPEDDSTKLLYVNSKDEDGNATIEPFIVNSALMATNGKYAKVEPYDGRNMLHIRNSSVTQANSHITKPGTHTEYSTVLDDAGVQQDKTVEVGNTIYLSVKFMAKTSGVLTIGMPDADHSDIDAMQYIQQNINSSYDWQTVQTYGTWDGNGDFVLGYTGEMYVALLSITEKPLDDYKKSVSTKFEQTADHISVLGENINKVDGRVTTLGTTWDAEKGEIYSYVDKHDESGLETAKTEIKQTADSITTTLTKYVDTEVGKNATTISEVKQTAEGLSSKVATLEGDVSNNSTLITQNAKSISLVAEKFNEDGSLVNTGGLMTTADGNSLSSQITDIDGKLLTKAEIATSVQYDPETKEVTSDIKLTADKITLTTDSSDDISKKIAGVQSNLDTTNNNLAETNKNLATTNENLATTNKNITTMNSDLTIAKEGAALATKALYLDDDGKVQAKSESGLLTTADKTSIIASAEEYTNGEIKNVNAKLDVCVTYDPETKEVTSEILLDAQKININGVVSANKNFQIDTNGNMTAANATISGKVTATEGSFTGTVNANDGKIGNFTIKDGWLTANPTTEQAGSYICIGNTTGNDNLFFFGDGIEPMSAGDSVVTTAVIRNGKPADSSIAGNTEVALRVLCAGGQAARRIALDARGFIKGVGGVSYITTNFGDNYMPASRKLTPSTAGHKTSNYYKSFLNCQNEFIFQPDADLVVTLPSPTELCNTLINGGYQQYQGAYDEDPTNACLYHLTFTNNRYSGGNLKVRGVSEALLVNNSGSTLNYIKGSQDYGQHVITKGASASFLYFNKTWYVRSVGSVS
jgi:hypothetical protein